MKEQNKSNTLTGASVAVGAVAGIASTSAFISKVSAANVAAPSVEVEPNEVEVVGVAPAHGTEAAAAGNGKGEVPFNESTPIPHPQQMEGGVQNEEAVVLDTESVGDPEVSAKCGGGCGGGCGSDADVEVLSYETVDDADLGRVDVAVVSVDDEQGVVVDMDRDGMADVLMVDENGDGDISDDEIVDVSEEGLSMSPFKESAPIADVWSDGGDDVCTSDNYSDNYSDEGSLCGGMDDGTAMDDADLYGGQDYVNDANVNDYIA